MSNVILAGIGTFVMFISLAGFSVYQMEKEAAELHGPGLPMSDPPSPASDGSPRPA